MSDKMSAFRLQQRIKKNMENVENYNTGLIGESMIVAGYEMMSLDKLEKLRYILNRLISKRKGLIEAQRKKDAVANTETDTA